MSLPIGDRRRMTGPHGFFVLDAAHAGDVVFGATGTGIAAVMPMLGELGRRPRAAAPEARRYIVYWGVRAGVGPVRSRRDRGARRAPGAELAST